MNRQRDGLSYRLVGIVANIWRERHPLAQSAPHFVFKIATNNVMQCTRRKDYEACHNGDLDHADFQYSGYSILAYHRHVRYQEHVLRMEATTTTS
jgi:hypothetical protein